MKLFFLFLIKKDLLLYFVFMGFFFYDGKKVMNGEKFLVNGVFVLVFCISSGR